MSAMTLHREAAATTAFGYLLNAMERAAQAENPAEQGYAEKREAVLDYVARQLSYIERLEAANSGLHQQFAEEQRERELLVQQGAVMVGEFTEWFQKIDTLRGKGTPRAIQR